jgi:polyisoprenoid-binding protein YceI
MTTAIQPRATTLTIDPAHSLVEFSAKHMMITTVKGRLADVKGTITLDEANPAASAVEVEFGAASIDTRVEQRDQHLRSADFLDVERYPTIRFVSRKVEGDVQGSFTVTGDLTIRGVTREVALAAAWEGSGRDPWGNEKLSFSATTKIDRRDYGLTWNAALETGGVLVGNELKIHIELQAVRAA